ncbi:PQQ-binding-like beta-propeller repeat protein [Marinobacterium stanieri]|nr:PQQ-binding-like beta-propeller repeat protein [Marinobacterium stanieri]
MMRNIIIWVMILVSFTMFFNFISNYKKNKYEIWSYSLPKLSTSPIIIFDDTLYFTDKKNKIYSLSKNGHLNWKIDLKCPLQKKLIVDKDHVLTRTNASYITFYPHSTKDCKNPEKLHIINRKNGLLDRIKKTKVLSYQKIADEIYYSTTTELFKFNIEQKKQIQIFDFNLNDVRLGGFDSDFHINGLYLYMKNQYQDVFAIDTKSNKVAWRFNSEWKIGEEDLIDRNQRSQSLIYDDNVIYTVNKVQHSSAADVYAFDANTGRILGRHHIEAGASPGRLSSSNRNIYVSSNDGRVHAMSKRNLYPVWDVPVRGRVLGALVPYEGRVYAGTQAGGIIGLDEKTGKRLYYYPTRHPIPGTPAIEDGIIYFATNGGSIHAVRLPEEHTSDSTGGEN